MIPWNEGIIFHSTRALPRRADQTLALREMLRQLFEFERNGAELELALVSLFSLKNKRHDVLALYQQRVMLNVWIICSSLTGIARKKEWQ